MILLYRYSNRQQTENRQQTRKRKQTKDNKQLTGKQTKDSTQEAKDN